MQFPGSFKPPVGVIFDADFGTQIDAVLALCLLYGFDGKNDTRVVTVSTTRSNLNSAAFCEVISRFYAGAVSGAIFAQGRTLPVGMATDGKWKNETPLMTAPLERKTPEGAPVYQHGIHKLIDTADPVAVIRNGFTAQQDQNCIVLLAGPATNLAGVLALPASKDLIAAKVRYLVIADLDRIRQADPASAAKLLSDWPTPIYVAPADLGQALPYPGASIEKDYSWSQAHPLADAYKAAGAMPYDAPAAAMAAALYAIKPAEGYFKVVDDGKLKRLTLDPAQKDKILKLYTEQASAKPVVRAPRRRPPVVDDKKPETLKPPPVKP